MKLSCAPKPNHPWKKFVDCAALKEARKVANRKKQRELYDEYRKLKSREKQRKKVGLPLTVSKMKPWDHRKGRVQ
jgi:hypothetical protein